MQHSGSRCRHPTVVCVAFDWRHGATPATRNPALLTFILGRTGLAEPFFRADHVDELVAYAARRHRVRDHLLILEYHQSREIDSLRLRTLFRGVRDVFSILGLGVGWYARSSHWPRHWRAGTASQARR